MKIFHKHFSGQTMVTLLIFVIVAMIITAGAVVLTLTNSRASEKFNTGTDAYYVAESGIENALLRVIRDPSYTGETLLVNSDSATITVSGTNPITILSIGRSGDFVRKIQVVASYTNNVLTVNSWKEVY
jgi:hypothetical protein